MRLSLQVHYAICGVFDLAYNGDGEPVQVRVIGDRQAIPARYLEQIFQRRRRAKLVRGKRGPGGGYTLARRPAEITIRDIVEAVEGPIRAGDGAADADDATRFRPEFLWGRLAAQFGAVLAEFSVEDLCTEAAQSAVPRSNAESLTYQI